MKPGAAETAIETRNFRRRDVLALLLSSNAVSERHYGIDIVLHVALGLAITNDMR